MGSTDTSENTCVVCFKNVVIYSIGDCDHPVCYECSTRMRVLCQQNECPICRQDMPKVIFTKEIQLFRKIKVFTYLMDKKYKICFDSAEIQALYNTLLEHVCTLCGGQPEFRTFLSLKDHMKKEHELHYCDLCVNNLKIFSAERRCYNRQDLALHRRKGDPDDTSHRGHPLCEFCEQRYMDNDELYRHLRREHLYCHFCDADGFHQYYNSYNDLRDHFRAEHYLCEEGECMDEQFTSVFRTEIDLKAHRASVHGRSIGKAATKQARTLELEFTLAPRPRDRDRQDRRGGSVRPRRYDEEDLLGAVGGGELDDPVSVFQNVQNLNTNCIEEFPTLNGAPTSSTGGPPLRSNGRKVITNNGGVTIRTMRQSQAPLAVTDENFPALGPESTNPGCKTVRLSVNSSSQDRAIPKNANIHGSMVKAPTNVSIHVNHRHTGGLMTRLSSNQNIRIRPTSTSVLFENDFPSLSGTKTPSSSTQWLSSQGTTGAKAKVQMQALPQQQPQVKKSLKVEDEFPSLNSKFKASCNITNTTHPNVAKTESKSKKASSLMIPVSNSWPSGSHSEDASGSKGKSGDHHLSSNQPKDSNSFASTSNNIGNIKVKSKKKKPKINGSPNSSNNSGGESSTSTKVVSATSLNNSHQKESKSVTIDFEQLLKQQLINRSKEEVLDIKEDKRSKQNNEGSRFNNSSERKRSELLIANLASKEPHENENLENGKVASSHADNDIMYSYNNVRSLDEYPSLVSAEGWPPRIDNDVSKLRSAPPPGFEGGGAKLMGRTPPPGFSVPVTLNSIARPNSMLMFTNSSGQNYPIHPNGSSKPFSFALPQNFDRRNKALVTRIMEVLHDPNDFEEFRQMSALFRQNMLCAESFYTHCQKAMGSSAFAEIFPELLVLLPDIDKQQELWCLHMKSGGESKCSNNKVLEICTTCRQVVTTSDIRHHLQKHTLDNHFTPVQHTESKVQAWSKK